MTDILAGRAAIVTGGSRGIGRAIAVQLAGAGALVCVHYRANHDAAQATVSAIEAQGVCAFALAADVAIPAQVDSLLARFDAVAADHGHRGIDILVNNAGLGIVGNIAQTDLQMFDRLFDINIKGLFFLTQQALSRMDDGGRVINISSMVSLSAYPGCIVYAMSKAAVNSFTFSLAVELGPRGITVNAIAPGATVTDFIESHLQDPTYVAALIGKTALGRLGQPDDIASAVAFLASPASGWITGQIIAASGGMQL